VSESGSRPPLGERVEQVVDELVVAVKPRLRGWLHAGTFPLAVVAGLVLVVLAEGTRATVGNAIYATSAALLFGVSALYHRGQWSPRTERLLKRLDHSNIFLIIAGTYTPFSLLLLEERSSRTLLWLVWAGAIAGIVFRVTWVGAPRWLYTPVYVALGWVAVFYLPDLARGGGTGVVVMLAIGGALYTAGRAGLCLTAAQPVTTVVRLPRGLSTR
jgi:hemolysin III